MCVGDVCVRLVLYTLAMAGCVCSCTGICVAGCASGDGLRLGLCVGGRCVCAGDIYMPLALYVCACVWAGCSSLHQWPLHVSGKVDGCLCALGGIHVRGTCSGFLELWGPDGISDSLG